jgi:VanZ family protein
MPMNFDKLGHLAFYFGTTLSWFLYFKSQKTEKGYKKSLIKAFLFSFVYGILIEVAQGLFTASRQPDIKDVLANTIGALLAISLIYLTKLSKSKNKAQ